MGVQGVRFTDAIVEVIDPLGTPHAMGVFQNPAGAYYYDVPLAGITLGGQYTFRVRLANGSTLETPVTVPAQVPVLTSPSVGQSLTNGQALTVTWAGNNGSKDASIVIRTANAPDIFSIVGTGRIQTQDDGTYPLFPVLNARQVGDVGAGTRYFTVTRRNTVSAGGFAPNSSARASIIYANEVNMTP